MDDQEGKHLQITLSSKDDRYSVGDSPFSIPSKVTCSELNTLVNELISAGNEDHSPIEFDFLLVDELLRSSLEESLTERGLSSEATLDIVYFPKHPAPESEGQIVLNDWISSVDCFGSYILSGSYNNQAYIWNRGSGQCLGSVEHLSSVKSVAWIRHSSSENPLFITGAADEALSMWQFFPEDGVCRCLHTYSGHGRSVDCLAMDNVGSRFCSGSWDRTVRVWSAVPDQLADTAHVANGGAKRKKTSSASDAQSDAVDKQALVTLTGHSEAVSSLAWLDSASIASASWDHCIKLWDLESASLTATLAGNNVFNSISYSTASRLIVSGNSDRSVRLWDPRSDTALVQKMLRFHTGWVSCVQWSPDNEHQLVSGSFDKTVCQWDIRSPKAPLYSMTGHTDKVMCVSWSERDLVVSGGADAQLRLYKT
ncbi:ribosome biogenesis protein wdr12-like [Sycon ciliatum]|uniref:ribosome biogenesis protein wdr12-like n=1 Tax=Sycon ciliatum TaxID=27933 RepID=UPI0031F691F6